MASSAALTLTQALILGVLQGMSEWLPISSSGNLMLLAMHAFGISPENAFGIAIFLHLGTMLSAIFYFRKEIFGIRHEKELAKFIIIATLLTAIFGMPIFFFEKKLFSSLSAKAATFLIGITLILTGVILKAKPKKARENFNEKDAIIAGIAQGIAAMPGISRSGITIASLLLRNIENELALKLSFIISIPAVAGAVFLDLITQKSSQAIFASPAYLAALLASFITGFLTIKYFIALSKKFSFSNFCIFIGIIAIAFGI